MAEGYFSVWVPIFVVGGLDHLPPLGLQFLHLLTPRADYYCLSEVGHIPVLTTTVRVTFDFEILTDAPLSPISERACFAVSKAESTSGALSQGTTIMSLASIAFTLSLLSFAILLS